MDRVQELLADWFDRAEPLGGRAEDDGLLGPPIMGIAMDDVDFLQEVAVSFQHLHHFVIGHFIEEAVEGIVFLQMHHAAAIHGAGRLDVVFAAGVEII